MWGGEGGAEVGEALGLLCPAFLEQVCNSGNRFALLAGIRL